MKRNSVATPAIERRALSIDEACAAAGIGRTLIYREIREGRLAPRKIGKRTVVLAADLEAWLNQLARVA